MKPNKLIFTSAVCLGAMAGASGLPAQKDATPKNILIFIADDLARNELGCYGGQNASTPNIDRFAGEGVRFNRMFSSTTMCCPTRASIYTGLYPVTHGVYKNHGTTKPDVKSVVHYFRDMGYRVGLTGKTHFRPKSVYPFEIINGFEPNCVARTADYSTGGIVEFMKRNPEQPFCLFVCSTLPHAPWTVGDPAQFDADKLRLPPHFVDNKETREAFTRYLAEIDALDRQFGEVLTAISDAGKESTTLVMFCGEQGPQFPGGKWTSWDYGQKSAFLIRSPEGYLEGSVSEAMLQYEDVLPTIIAYGGGKIPDIMQGESFMPVLLGKTSSHRKWAYGVHNNVPEGSPYPIRSIRNNRYKLIVNLTPEASYFEKHLMAPVKDSYWNAWVRDAKTNEAARYWVDRYITRPAVEFYDITRDPWELDNLASDKKMEPLIHKLEKELYKWMDEKGDTGKELDVEEPVTSAGAPASR
ncbi:MAG: sulfatase [Mangrovibacterium sp.]